jgi:homoserine O-acetyltransferase
LAAEQFEVAMSAPATVKLPRYEVEGPADAPVVVALGGISAHHHIRATKADPSQGWWESAPGQGCPLPKNGYRFVGATFLDAGRGEDGRPKGIVTTHDQADAIAGVLDEIGVQRVHALIGASYGGMVALAFAERYPQRLERLIVIAAAHQTHPMTMSLKILQRRIVELGLETGRAQDALVLARALAMTTFRTAKEFAQRFAIEPVSQTRNDATFPVESYLRHHGERFAARFTPARFLALSLSGDLHNVDPSRITARTTLVAADGDANVPRELVDELASKISGLCRIAELHSISGHDAFLTEPQALGRILEEALS